MKQNMAPVSVQKDDKLVSALTELFRLPKGQRPSAIVETGTYHGTGTTAMIISAAQRAFKRPDMAMEIFTIEADSNNHAKAVENLGAYRRWVRCIHGSSVDTEAAKDFILNDEMLLNHHLYPSIAMDAADPVPFYLQEVEGKLGIFGGSGPGADNVFDAIWPEIKDRVCLFVLDSAGGIGYLEFQTVCELMGNRLWYLWCHDTNHVKHFRTVRDIRQAKKVWNVLAEKTDEWILATHLPKGTK